MLGVTNDDKPIFSKHLENIIKNETKHGVKSVRIRSYSGPYFTAFGLNMEGYIISLRIQSEYGHFSRSEKVHAISSVKRYKGYEQNKLIKRSLIKTQYRYCLLV